MHFFLILIHLIIFFFSVIIHEVAHGYVAFIRGDPTAKEVGRLTLNPLPHIDLFGTIILPLILAISRSGIIIGWAKPVPINPYFFENPKKDIMWVGAAGPLSNIGIAFILSILYRIGLYKIGSISQFIEYGVAINLLLAIFNLVPVPPLDGSRILQAFLPYELREKYLMIERFGFLIIFFLLWIGLFQFILIPIMKILFYLFIGKPFF